MKKLAYLKLVIVCLYVLFAVLMGLGAILEVDALVVWGLMVFTAASALVLYYLVLTQS